MNRHLATLRQMRDALDNDIVGGLDTPENFARRDALCWAVNNLQVFAATESEEPRCAPHGSQDPFCVDCHAESAEGQASLGQTYSREDAR